MLAMLSMLAMLAMSRCHGRRSVSWA